MHAQGSGVGKRYRSLSKREKDSRREGGRRREEEEREREREKQKDRGKRRIYMRWKEDRREKVERIK